METTKHFRSCAGSLTALSALLVSDSAAAQSADVPKQILAAQLRKQGFSCKTPLSAERDPNAQYNDAVWVLTCDDGRYRMTLVPNMAAKIEKLPDQNRDLDQSR